jgi:hypothetical protein
MAVAFDTTQQRLGVLALSQLDQPLAQLPMMPEFAGSVRARAVRIR